VNAGENVCGCARRVLQASVICTWLLLFVEGKWKLRRDQ